MNQFEDLSTELLISIFDYLTSIEILLAFFHLNERFRWIICHHFRTNSRLTQIDFSQTNVSTSKLFSREILPDLKSTITSFHLGSSFHYGQIDEFNQYQLQRLDSLTIELINPQILNDILHKFLNYNRLQWFDRITLIINEETIGWNEQIPFCVQNIPVRQFEILGKVPYVFAQRLLTTCYSITHLNIHLKFDHGKHSLNENHFHYSSLVDLLCLLYHLPNLIQCKANVDDRGRDISNDRMILVPLPALNLFHYHGLMPSIYLRRCIMEMNEHIKHLAIFTQDYQWPFHSPDGFSSDFFDRLVELETFDFYFRLITSDNFKSSLSHLIDRKLCKNIACLVSKDIGQVFSLPYAFDHIEIFEKNFFNQIHSFKIPQNNDWNSITHLTLRVDIYDPALLKSIEENLRQLRSIDYQVPHFSLNPQENEFEQYNLQLSKFVLNSSFELQ